MTLPADELFNQHTLVLVQKRRTSPGDDEEALVDDEISRSVDLTISDPDKAHRERAATIAFATCDGSRLRQRFACTGRLLTVR